MAGNAYDRFTAGLTVTSAGNPDPWAFARRTWDIALKIMASADVGRIYQHLWASGNHGFDVRREDFDELHSACQQNAVDVAFMFLSAQSARLSEVTGVSLYFRPNERSLSLSVRGDARAAVERAARDLDAALRSSWELTTVAGGTIQVTVEPLGVSTTNTRPSLGSQSGRRARRFEPAPAAPSGDTVPKSDIHSDEVDEIERRYVGSASGVALTHSAMMSLAANLARMREMSVTDDQPQMPTGQRTTAEWFRKSWRDHTATFILTIVASVLAAAVIALLGISYLPNLFAVLEGTKGP